MDPNTAFENILTGFAIFDHAEALSEWLAKDGFAPTERALPETCAPFVREHIARHYPDLDHSAIRVRADRAGLWTAPLAGQWLSLAIWPDLLKMQD